MSRYKAAALHLAGSVIVLLLLLGLISQILYPGALFRAAAGFELLRLLMVVDMIIGPLVTLIIFNPKKKLIKMDMAIVLLCQLGFMAYGAASIYIARPVYMVFTGHNFHMVRANEIEPKDLAKVTLPQYKQLPLLGCTYVGAIEPLDPKIKNDIAFAGLGGMGLQNLPQYFVPLNQFTDQVIAAAKTSKQWKVIDADNKKKLELYEQQHPDIQVSFLALVNPRFTLFVVLEAKTGKIIDVI